MPAPKTVVWVGGSLALYTCPKSYISAASLMWIEEFSAWRLAGGADYRDLPAKTVDAFTILAREATENRHGQQQ